MTSGLVVNSWKLEVRLFKSFFNTLYSRILTEETLCSDADDDDAKY